MLNPSLKRRIKIQDDNKCVSCGSTENLTIDHIIPKSMGGTDDAWNLQTMCKWCNIQKSNKTTVFKIIKTYLAKKKNKPFDDLKNQLNITIGNINTRLKSEHAVLLQRLNDVKSGVGQYISDIAKINRKIDDQGKQYLLRISGLEERLALLENPIKPKRVVKKRTAK